ncbi:transglutaminase TgpA family protein [Methylophaga sp.]|uniref:transglutaminase TgpA family protein n=1 Tax=Methylophaga sp. TaxID=2024840 RepID=UPI003F6975DC
MAKNDLSPPQHTINSLILALFIGAVPHFVYQPIWVGLMFIMMMGWRLLHNFRGWPLPAANRWLKVFQNAVAGLTIIVIVSQFNLTIGRDAGVALLTIMLAFKVVEIRSLRDYYLCVFLGFFLVITNFFFSQSILMVILMLLVVILLTRCLLAVNAVDARQSAKSQITHCSKMVLQAIPVMLFLFVLFPRIPGPIWGLPEDANTASTGLSEEMSPGSISNLVESDEIAFRVKFDDNQVPPQNALYWRGPVLWQTDGTTWTKLEHHQLKWQSPTIENVDNSYRYKITLEPHDENWLLALDLPTELPKSPASFLTPDGRLVTKKNIKQRTQYPLVSHTTYSFNAESDPNIKAALQLPDDAHPKAVTLAQQWRDKHNDPEAIIDTALAFFSNQAFFYTLTPPVISGDTVDGFLFGSRQGFCEHYAASFTVLMRAAGIPTRVVTGYLGGDLNPVDNLLVVRQRDAHAWTEVWLADKGWKRIDPTAAVSQNRIDRGMSDILPASRRSPVFIAKSDALVELWQQMQNNWDAFNSAWDMWVVAYGPEKQFELLSLLGMKNPDWQKMALWLMILLSMTGLVMLLLTYKRRHHADPAVSLYQSFCRKLERLDLHRQSFEGPNDFAMRAKQALPAYKQQITHITDLYIQIRYRQVDDALMSELKQQVKDFRPRRR